MNINDIITSDNKYILSLINVDFINFDLSEIKKDGMVHLVLDSKKLLRPVTRPSSENWILDNLSKTEYCCIIFNPSENRCEELLVEHHAVVYNYNYVSLMYFMEMLNYPEYENYKFQCDNFGKNIMEWLKSQIRTMMLDLPGKFINDTIKKDTYFQMRNYECQNIYYIICRWWEKLKNDEISLVDIINDGSLFIAQN